MYRRIRDLREDRDLLQRDLAAYLQCSQAVSYTHLIRSIPHSAQK